MVLYSSTLVFEGSLFVILKPCTMMVMNTTMLNGCKWFSCKESYIIAQTTKLKGRPGSLRWVRYHQLFAFFSHCIASKTSFIIISIIIISCYRSLKYVIWISWKHGIMLSCIGLLLMGLLDKVCEDLLSIKTFTYVKKRARVIRWL